MFTQDSFTQDSTTQDSLHRYLFEDAQVRGELVQLQQAYQQVLASQSYPPQVRRLLGELLVATSLLTATLKFEGAITVQLQGDGPLRLAVINGNHRQQLRGVARWEGQLPDSDDLRQLVGRGHLAITITPDQGERYQGIVALEHPQLAQCIEQYFSQSEQLPTRLWLRTGIREGTAHAAGMLLQILPSAEPDRGTEFDHLSQLTATVRDDELFELPAETLLYRLYHQEKVKLFPAQTVEFSCSCSRERSIAALQTLDPAEVRDLLAADGQIDMHCDYCGSHYLFDAVDVASLLSGGSGTPSQQRH